MSDSVQTHRQQPTRLPHPWDSPGKNTGVGCHFLLQCMKVKSERQVAQLCLTLSDPMDCSPPSCSIHGIFQARVKKGCYFISWHQNALWEKNIFGLTLEKERWSCQEYVGERQRFFKEMTLWGEEGIARQEKGNTEDWRKASIQGGRTRDTL